MPTLGNRVKNFENWLLVELVHRLRVEGADLIKTNGFLPDWRPTYWNKSDRFLRVQEYLRSCRLKGPKIDVKSLSPDLSFMVDGHGRSCPGSGGKEKWRILPVGEVHDQPAALAGGHRRNAPWGRVSGKLRQRMGLSPPR